jgi:hypothetical protein
MSNLQNGPGVGMSGHLWRQPALVAAGVSARSGRGVWLLLLLARTVSRASQTTSAPSSASTTEIWWGWLAMLRMYCWENRTTLLCSLLIIDTYVG